MRYCLTHFVPRDTAKALSALFHQKVSHPLGYMSLHTAHSAPKPFALLTLCCERGPPRRPRGRLLGQDAVVLSAERFAIRYIRAGLTLFSDIILRHFQYFFAKRFHPLRYMSLHTAHSEPKLSALLTRCCARTTTMSWRSAA